MENGDEYLTAGQARELLGVSKVKMAQLLRDGVLPATVDPLSRRQKLVKRSDVERLRRESEELRSHMARVETLAVA